MSDIEGMEEVSASPCLICHDTGFVHPILPSGKPDYSRTIPCRCAHDRLVREQIENPHGSFPGYHWAPEFELQKSMTFDNFELDKAFAGSLENLKNRLSEEKLEELKEARMTLWEYRELLRENLKLAYRSAQDFAKSPENWLIFMGQNGCGKTHLAAAIVNYCYQHQQPALFVVVPDLLDHLRSTFNPESKVSYDQIFERVKTASLLVLDDLGEHSTTPWAHEKLYQVLNYRYNAQLATVVTTSCALGDLDNAISSRLSDVKFSNSFYIQAPDFRSSRRPSEGTRKTYRRGKKTR